MNAVLKQIGVVHSPLQTLNDCPLQENENAPEAVLEIFPEYVKGIKDLKVGNNIVLLTWLHEADRTVVECIPRREFGSAKLGVFSTRSPDRPNPIGIHVVKILSISDRDRVRVSNLEVLDNTPLIDLKPVLDDRSFGS